MGDTSGGGFSFGGIFDALLADLLAAVQAIIAFLNALVGAIVNALNFLYAGILGSFQFNFAGDVFILRWLRRALEAILQGGLIKALSHLYSLYQKLRAFLLKLKAWLDRLHALQQKYMLQSLRRIINMIQRVRKVLVIFRLFHVKFAARLDAWLAGIEGKLIRNLFLMARKSNTIISWLNWLIDPLGQIKRNVLLRSLFAALDALMMGLTGKSWAAVFGLSKTGGTAPLHTAPISKTMDISAKHLLDQTGDEGAVLARGPALRAQLFAEMGLPEPGNG